MSKTTQLAMLQFVFAPKTTIKSESGRIKMLLEEAYQLGARWASVGYDEFGDVEVFAVASERDIAIAQLRAYDSLSVGLHAVPFDKNGALLDNQDIRYWPDAVAHGECPLDPSLSDEEQAAAYYLRQ